METPSFPRSHPIPIRISLWLLAILVPHYLEAFPSHHHFYVVCLHCCPAAVPSCIQSFELCGMFTIPKWVALFYPLGIINHHLSISSLLWPPKSRFSAPTCCHCRHRHQATTAARGLARRDPHRVGPAAMDFHGTAAEGPPKAETMAARNIHEGWEIESWSLLDLPF